MSFRQRMKGKRSRMELLVQIELQRRKLHKTMKPPNDTVVILLENVRLPIVAKEKFTEDMAKKVPGSQALFTLPDFMWTADNNPKVKARNVKGLCVYLNGPVHNRNGARTRDEWIVQRLQQLHYDVLVFPFKAPTKKGVLEVVDEIERWIS